MKEFRKIISIWCRYDKNLVAWITLYVDKTSFEQVCRHCYPCAAQLMCADWYRPGHLATLVEWKWMFQPANFFLLEQNSMLWRRRVEVDYYYRRLTLSLICFYLFSLAAVTSSWSRVAGTPAATSEWLLRSRVLLGRRSSPGKVCWNLHFPPTCATQLYYICQMVL